MKLRLLLSFVFISVYGFAQMDPAFSPLVLKASTIKKVAKQTDNKLIVIGDFVAAGAVPVSHIARLNADGTVDNSFLTGTGFTLNSSSSLTLSDLIILPSGKILVCGSFDSYNGKKRSKLVRLNSDGTIDDAFDPGVGPDYAINNMALQSDGKIVVRGYFSNFGGSARSGIARLNEDGSLDTGFNPVIENRSNIFSASANYCVTVQADQKILIGGQFTHINTIPHNNIVRLKPDGGIDETFVGGADGEVNDIDVMTSGKIVIVGRFTTVNGVPNYNQVARLNADGTIDNTFTINPTYFPSSNSTTTSVIQSDGKVIVAGNFQNPTYRILRLNTNGTIDNTFNVGTGLQYNGFCDVTGLLLSDSETTVFAAGSFANYNGVSRPGLVKIFTSNGSIDAFNSKLGSPGKINAIQVQSDGKVIIGGDFLTVQGETAQNIARVNTDGTIDNTFISGTGFNGEVNSMVIQTEGVNAGKLIVSGNQFSRYNSQSIRPITRLNQDGSLDNSFVAGQLTGYSIIRSLIKLANDDLIVGGYFEGYGGVMRRDFIRISANGALDNSFNTSNYQFVEGIWTVVQRSDSKFVTFAGNYVGKPLLHASDGNPEPGFGSPTISDIYTAGVQTDNKIVIGGSFSSAGAITTRHLARLNDDGTVDPTYKIKKLYNEDYVYRINQYKNYLFLALAYNGSKSGNRFSAVNNDGFKVPLGIDVLQGEVITFKNTDGFLYVAGKGVNVAGIRTTSIGRFLIPTAPNASPVNLTATKKNQYVGLAWQDSNNNETGFEILRSSVNNANYRSVGFTNELAFTDSSVVAQTNYYYKVRAINLGGESGFSTEVNIVSGPSIPVPPVISSGSEIGATIFTLRWNDLSSNEDGFRIYRSDDVGKNYSLVGTTLSNVISYTDKDLKPLTYYLYRLSSFNESGEAFANTTVGPTTKIIVAPSNLIAEQTASLSVRLTWKDELTLPRDYEIRRSDDGGANFNSIVKRSFTQTVYVDEGLEINKTYTYKIRSVSGEDGSVFSNPVNITMTITGLENEDSMLKLYPNPVLSNLYIEGGAADGTLVLIDALGQHFKNVLLPANSRTVLDLSTLSTGIYFVKVNIGSEVRIEKIIKN